MNKSELDKKFNNGEQWGFIKETDDRDYLGWILISKRPKFKFTPKREDYSVEDLYLYKA